MYKYFSLPVPATPSSIAGYRSLRLTSLRVDAANFGSNYAREAAFTDETWHERLSSPFARTFIAAVGSTPSMARREDGPSSSWVGTVSILAPSAVPPACTEALEQAGLSTRWEPYLIVAMWVQPEHRGRGVGKQLVRRGLEWARTFTDPKFTGDVKEREKVVILAVHDHNTSACSLYTKIGFRELEGVPWEVGQRWMTVKI